MSTQQQQGQQKRPPSGSTNVVPVDDKWQNPTNKAGLEALAPMVTDAILKGMPGFMSKPEIAQRMIRCLITECQSNARLLECTPLSLFGCAIKGAQMGLEIGGPLGQAYMIPFKNNKNKFRLEAQFIPGYRGLITLAHRSRMIRRITPVTVRKGDPYQVIRGTRQDIIHNPKPDNLATACAYYVVVELVNGGIDFEEFSIIQAIQFRDRYSTSRDAPDNVKAYSPWYQDAEINFDDKGNYVGTTGSAFDAMAMKTLIRRIAKRIPMSAELANAISLEDGVERGIPQAQLLGLPNAGERMPDLLAPVTDDAEETEPKDGVNELQNKLDEANAAGGGDGTKVDFLGDAIKRLNATGAPVEELCEAKGVKIGDVKKMTGADRSKWTDIINAEAERVEKMNADKK